MSDQNQFSSDTMSWHFSLFCAPIMYRMAGKFDGKFNLTV